MTEAETEWIDAESVKELPDLIIGLRCPRCNSIIEYRSVSGKIIECYWCRKYWRAKIIIQEAI